MCCAERRRARARFPLETRAARTPQAPALLFRPGVLPGPAARTHSLTFAQLDEWTAAIARTLLARGVAHG